MTLQEQFGEIDIYVFDQILRGNIRPGMRVVDAGCGGGRNLVYLLREGFDVYGVDAEPEAVAGVRAMARELAPKLDKPAAAERFEVAPVETMPFADGFADVVICNTVLHFARSDAQFEAMANELWRVLRPDGMLFCRLASTIGAGAEAGGGVEFELLQAPGTSRRYRLVDRRDWYLVDAPMLTELTRRMGGELIDPLKTTVVQGQRCMTTWVVRKRA